MLLDGGLFFFFFHGEEKKERWVGYEGGSGYRSDFRLTPSSSRRGLRSSRYSSYCCWFSTLAWMPVLGFGGGGLAGWGMNDEGMGFFLRGWLV